MFKNIWNQILAWLVPSRIFSTLTNVLTLWKTSDVKERGLLLIVFFPMLLCLGGMAFSLISFALFVLPSFVVKMFMWGALVMLFNFIGNYGFEYLTGRKANTGTSSGFGASWWSGAGNNSNNKSSGTGSSNADNNNFEFTDVSFTEDSDNNSNNNSGDSGASGKTGAQDHAREQAKTSTPFQKWYERVRGGSDKK